MNLLFSLTCLQNLPSQSPHLVGRTGGLSLLPPVPRKWDQEN
jgi:hypothetical protein